MQSRRCNCKPKFSLPGPPRPWGLQGPPPRGLVGHCTSGRPLNPPLSKETARRSELFTNLHFTATTTTTTTTTVRFCLTSLLFSRDDSRLGQISQRRTFADFYDVIVRKLHTSHQTLNSLTSSLCIPVDSTVSLFLIWS